MNAHCAQPQGVRVFTKENIPLMIPKPKPETCQRFTEGAVSSGFILFKLSLALLSS